jgi:hypothetical protein
MTAQLVVKNFQEKMLGAADATEAAVLDLWDKFLRGEIDANELRWRISVVIARANAAVVGVADTALTAQIEAETGSPATVSGVPPADDTARLLRAVETIQAATPGVDIAMQLSRLARAEPIASAQHATVEAMQSHRIVEGWTRQMDGDPCQLCRWWWREGRVWPKDHPFQRHPGCNCQPRIVLNYS